MAAVAARADPDGHRLTLGQSSPQDLSLTSWYAQANELEIQAEILAGRIAAVNQRLPSAREETVLERTRRDVVAKDNMLRQRAISKLKAQVQDARKLRDAEIEKQKSLDRDIKGLIRSLNKLREQAGHATNSVEIKKEQAAGASASENASHVEEESLRSNLQCMGEVQKSLAERVALEREKRLKLKAAARAKLARVEDNQAGERQELGNISRDFEKWKAKLKDQEAKYAKTEKEFKETLLKAQDAETRAKKAQAEKGGMQRELLEMQLLHEKLVTELDTTGSRLQGICSRQREERELWQAKQLEKIDTRVHLRRQLDQEEVVARNENAFHM